MSTWQRYLLFQIPGWLIAAAVLLGLSHWKLLPPWLGIVCFLAWVLKDLMLYPLLHRAYQTNVKTGLQALVGARGFAHDDLSPKGFVRVQGELWNARALPADQMIVAGTEVEIVSAERMMVFVRTVAENRKF
jgi:membrane protein implicated in regulation of membrane protease activity